MEIFELNKSFHMNVMILTSSGFGLSGKRLAATRKMSGAGFPSLTSGSLEPMTLWPNNLNSSLWCVVLTSTDSFELEVAKQMGMLLS